MHDVLGRLPRSSIESSRNHVLRYQGVDIDPVNWGWLCDKGRFDFEAVEHEDRLGEPLVRDDGELVGGVVGRGAARRRPRRCASASTPRAPTRVGVLGGARLTNEAAYAWAKLAKGVIGTDNVDCQLGDGLPAEVVLRAAAGHDRRGLRRRRHRGRCSRPTSRRSCRSCSSASATPCSSHGVQGRRAGAASTRRLTPLAAASLRYRPGEAGVVAGRSSVAGGAATGRRRPRGRPRAARRRRRGSSSCSAGRRWPRRPTHRRRRRRRSIGARPRRRLPAARCGGPTSTAPSTWASRPACCPGRSPSTTAGDWFDDRRWDACPPSAGLDAAGILHRRRRRAASTTLVLLGADPLADFPDHDLAAPGPRRRAHGHRRRHPPHRVGRRRPTSCCRPPGPARTTGTTTNIEGRVCTLEQKVTPPGTARADWIIAAELAFRLGARPRPRVGRRHLGGDRAASRRATPASPPSCSRSAAGRRRRRSMPLDPDPARRARRRPRHDRQPAPRHRRRRRGRRRRPRPPARRPTRSGRPPRRRPRPSRPSGSATTASDRRRGGDATARRGPRAGPRCSTFAPPDAAPTELPPVDAYSLRLVATRTLYDQGTLVAALAVARRPGRAGPRCASTRPTSPASALGDGAGSRCRRRGAASTLEAVADPAVPAGQRGDVRQPRRRRPGRPDRRRPRRSPTVQVETPCSGEP